MPKLKDLSLTKVIKIYPLDNEKEVGPMSKLTNILISAITTIRNYLPWYK